MNKLHWNHRHLRIRLTEQTGLRRGLSFQLCVRLKQVDTKFKQRRVPVSGFLPPTQEKLLPSHM